MAIFKHRFYTSFGFSRKINGKEQFIEFIEGSNEADRPAFLITRDEDVIKAVKELKAFKDGNIIEESDIDETIEETPWVAQYTYPGVTNSQSAKEVLMTEHSADSNLLKSAKEVKEYAHDNFILFPDWK